MNKRIKKISIIITLIVIFIFIIYIAVKYRQNNNITNIEQINNDITNENMPISKKIEETQNNKNIIDYSISKINFYNELYLNQSNKEYVFINYANEQYITFSVEQFYNQKNIGRASSTKKIGIYDLENNSLSYIKEFNTPSFVYDTIIDKNNKLIYVYFDESDNWFIKEKKDNNDILIDYGKNFFYMHMPKLSKVGNDIFYLYEKVIVNDNYNKYEYGINKLNENDIKYSNLVINSCELNLNDNNNIEGLISQKFLSSKSEYAYLTENNGKAVLNIFNSITNISQKITIIDKMYNIAILENSVIMSLEDKETRKIKLLNIPLKNNKNLTTEDNSVYCIEDDIAYYRMVSDGHNTILCIDNNFNIYIFNIQDNKIVKQKVQIDGHMNEPVLFIPVSKNKFLLHYSDNTDYQKNDLYTITIK